MFTFVPFDRTLDARVSYQASANGVKRWQHDEFQNGRMGEYSVSILDDCHVIARFHSGSHRVADIG